MSPEYAVFGKFSIKSNVFSFGIILLEIISGKKSNSFNQKDPSPSMIGQVSDKNFSNYCHYINPLIYLLHEVFIQV